MIFTFAMTLISGSDEIASGTTSGAGDLIWVSANCFSSAAISILYILKTQVMKAISQLKRGNGCGLEIL